MFRLRRQSRLNPIVALALALLISNVAALSCAMAYSLCVDCFDHPPVVCAQPCVESEAVIADTSPDESNNRVRPMALLPSLNAVDTGQNYSENPIAAIAASCELPAVPVRLRFCVFLK